MKTVVDISPFIIPTEYHTFVELMRGREDEFPVLARAARLAKPATNPSVKWAVPDGGVWENYTQIIRFPYDTNGAAEGAPMAEPRPDPLKDEQLSLLLAAVELVLVDGVPSRQDDPPITTCGGYKHYLGRDLRDDDVLSLRSLRDPMWRVFTHTGFDREEGPVLLDRPIGEWITEVSLQVVPGDG